MLRRAVPLRTYTERISDYKACREYLQADFNGRCGYCDIHDEVLMIPFHIDHFAPLKHFKELENEYSNLVYSCPSCNRSKWHHWPMDNANPSHDGHRGFVDPCDDEYDSHLDRMASGAIVPKTSLGTYMRTRLKLQLLKHRYLWLLDKAIEQCEKINEVLQSSDENDPDVKELQEKHYELLKHFMSYHNIVRNNK
jgi:uncharacterized protein (TIGR02646 family)